MRLPRPVRRALPAALALALAAPAAAGAAPHVIVWSGSLAPHTAATGVELRADGSGRRLTGDAAGGIVAAGAFTPSTSELAAIRAAATKLLHAGPSVTHAPERDGGYVTVLVGDADSAAVTALLAPMNRALTQVAKLLPAGRKNNAPARASCPTHQATDVTKEVPLSQASGLGLVGVHAKGPIGGDSMASTTSTTTTSTPTRRASTSSCPCAASRGRSCRISSRRSASTRSSVACTPNRTRSTSTTCSGSAAARG